MLANACGSVSTAKLTHSPLDAVAVYCMRHSWVWWLALQPSSYLGVPVSTSPRTHKPYRSPAQRFTIGMIRAITFRARRRQCAPRAYLKPTPGASHADYAPGRCVFE